MGAGDGVVKTVSVWKALKQWGLEGRKGEEVGRNGETNGTTGGAAESASAFSKSTRSTDRARIGAPNNN